MKITTLAPELEDYAAASVAAGRFRDTEHLVAAALTGLQAQEAQRAALLASVLAAEAEAEEKGYITGAAVEAEMRALLQKSTNAGA